MAEVAVLPMPDRGVRGLVEGFLAGTAPGAAIGDVMVPAWRSAPAVTRASNPPQSKIF
jgi:hypothetical protein